MFSGNKMDFCRGTGPNDLQIDICRQVYRRALLICLLQTLCDDDDDAHHVCPILRRDDRHGNHHDVLLRDGHRDIHANIEFRDEVDEQVTMVAFLSNPYQLSSSLYKLIIILINNLQSVMLYMNVMNKI